MDQENSLDSHNLSQNFPLPTQRALIDYYLVQFQKSINCQQSDYILSNSQNKNLSAEQNQSQEKKQPQQIQNFKSQNWSIQLNYNFKTKKIKKIKKNTKSQRKMTNSTYSQSILNQTTEKKRKPYPTKNFLAQFKKSHLNYLQKKTKLTVETKEFIIKLKNKNGISMRDYQKIYKKIQLKDSLIQFFNTRQLYRFLMYSRLKIERKLIYLKKLHVFQESFLRGKFDHIN